MEIKMAFDPNKIKMKVEVEFRKENLPNSRQRQQLLQLFVVFEHQPKFEQFFDVLLDRYV
jgi:hypothetical protein